MPQHWIRFSHPDGRGFGLLEGDAIVVHEGDMFAAPRPTARRLALAEVEVLTPTEPSKMIALWNNFRALGEKLGLALPPEPLYFQKASNSFLPTGGVIRRPGSYSGRVVFEGELGIVIGKTCKEVPENEIAPYIFGYTCINDVTAVDILNKDPSFPQWSRAKSFDTFGVFGPVVASGHDPDALHIRTVLDGVERQNYPVADMIFPPRRLVSLLSMNMTLSPGDVICCGTSLGAGSMKGPRNEIEVAIDGVGRLRNTYVDTAGTA